MISGSEYFRNAKEAEVRSGVDKPPDSVEDNIMPVIKKLESHSGEMMTSLALLKSDNSFCDVTIKSGDLRIRAHRNVLASATDYFKGMFLNWTKEAESAIVDFSIMAPAVVKQCIEFIYSGRVKITVETVRDLLDASEMLHLPGLSRLCVEFLAERVDIKSCAEVVTLSNLYNKESLNSPIERFLLNQFEEFAQSDDFISLDCDSIMYCLDLLERDCQDRELNKWRSIVRWANYDTNRRGSHFPKLFKTIDLSCFTRSFIEKEIYAESLVFDSKECLKIIANVMFNENKMMESHKKRSMFNFVVAFNRESRLIHQYNIKAETWSILTRFPWKFPTNMDMIWYKGVLYISNGYRLFIFSDGSWMTAHENAYNSAGSPGKQFVSGPKNESNLSEKLQSSTISNCSQNLKSSNSLTSPFSIISDQINGEKVTSTGGRLDGLQKFGYTTKGVVSQSTEANTSFSSIFHGSLQTTTLSGQQPAFAFLTGAQKSSSLTTNGSLLSSQTKDSMINSNSLVQSKILFSCTPKSIRNVAKPTRRYGKSATRTPREFSSAKSYTSTGYAFGRDNKCQINAQGYPFGTSYTSTAPGFSFKSVAPVVTVTSGFQRTKFFSSDIDTVVKKDNVPQSLQMPSESQKLSKRVSTSHVLASSGSIFASFPKFTTVNSFQSTTATSNSNATAKQHGQLSTSQSQTICSTSVNSVTPFNCEISIYSRCFGVGNEIFMITSTCLSRFHCKSSKWNSQVLLNGLGEGFLVAASPQKIYLMGGKGSEKCVREYDIRSSELETLSSMVLPKRCGHAFWFDGRVYAFGGGYPANVECYDPEMDRWCIIPFLQIERRPAKVFIGDKLYMVGGDAGYGFCSVELDKLKPPAGGRIANVDMYLCCPSTY